MKIRRRAVAYVSCWIASLCLLGAKEPKSYDLREGDIVFSSSAVGQGEAIMAATASPYTHCGIVFQKDGRWMVLEAVQPVCASTLRDFMARGNSEEFTARRLNAAVTPEAYRKARTWAEAQIGRDYDVRFGWDDKKLYCSELVWKFYEQAGVKLCPLRKFRDYHLQRPAVKRIIEQRYGSIEKLPLDETVVAPSDLAASPLLAEVPIKAE